jgi:hypothetical protein
MRPDLRGKRCAPSATRTRDLLLRRHSRNVASHGSAWPHVQVSGAHHGWMWLGMVLCLRSLAPHLAPRNSLATLRFECSGGSTRYKQLGQAVLTQKTRERDHRGPAAETYERQV